MSATGLTRAALEALPVGAVVLDSQGTAWQCEDAADSGNTSWWNPASVQCSPTTGTELHRDARPLALLFDPSHGYVARDGAQLALPLRKVGV